MHAMRRWQSILIVLLQFLAVTGHITLLFFVIAALATYGNLSVLLLMAASLGFSIASCRLLFPWPLTKAEVIKTARFVRPTLWAALWVGALLSVLGALDVAPLHGWWKAFAVLAATSALTLLTLCGRRGQLDLLRLQPDRATDTAYDGQGAATSTTES